jgi:hypothetical protein
MTEEEYKTKKFWFLISDHKKTMIVNDTFGEVDKKKYLNWTSRSYAYETMEELIEKEGVPEKPCIKCGNIFGTNYHISKELIDGNICFSCYFWQKYVEIKDLPKIARIDGTHYVIEPDNPNAAFKGFGGAEFKIKFHDGREVVTHNLWYQGEIPKHFRDELPDNAVFIQS